MAERDEHRRILDLLASLDAGLLQQAECWFAGGTAISLRCDEFRLSRDVDFLCASREGYRMMRHRVYEAGVRGLFTSDVTVRRELRADRYGIRVVLDVAGAPLKLEIVSEGRIDLAGVDDPALPVARLTDEDLVAEKLLANEDRFLDDAALGRDVIDLILLEHSLGELPQVAWDKAREAYGPSVEDAWNRALRRLRDRPEWRARALEALSVTPEARAVVEARVERCTDER
ncbi:nucleotidyl transferase AbiEii/AbiGii toxin family protein [Sorangium sp. So ce406]|uniref:nucleotidyl transferase AbiEii/AbiGii toxin family protein n=1 Tax=Sorangium sp. So ce406 TaxID=3133311 RepID=UPI003F5C96BB